MTPKEASELLAFAQLCGLDPTEAMVGNPRGAATAYAGVLTANGVTLAEAQAAVTAIVAKPWTSEYRRRVPTPGEIIARTPVGRLALTLGTDADADRALADFTARMRLPPGDGRLDPLDPHRSAAMAAGLRAVGGPSAWLASDVGDRSTAARWRAAYCEARKAQAEEPRTVRAMLATVTQRQIEGAK